MRVKRFVGSILSAGVMLTTMVVSAPAASAATAYGCGYPQVCFYKTKADWDARRWTAAYKDITNYNQVLGSSAAGSYAVYNSRNDDGAFLRFAIGTSHCLLPNEKMTNITNSYVETIRIYDSASC
ncbi:hypothetical protein ACFHW0_07490 [Micromonospora sp. LOL_025]|uniref:hypothetical protein n=1 Tax=Micromonospora sp. LOL_025 TaxID=3345413 RepID=UPI003A8BD14C